mgnify:FL=1
MPPTTPPSGQLTTNRKTLWVVVPVVLLLTAALAYFWSNPTTAPVQPAASVSAPVSLEAVGTRHIYSETADPQADIAAALEQAKNEHKRVLIDFGGDWCPDCQMLDI